MEGDLSRINLKIQFAENFKKYESTDQPSSI